jgi:hypothetical protein
VKLTLPLEEEDQAVHRGQLREAGLIKRVQLLHLHARATVASIPVREYKYTQHQIPTMQNWQVHFCITVYNVSKTDGHGLGATDLHPFHTEVLDELGEDACGSDQHVYEASNNNTWRLYEPIRAAFSN